MKEDEYLLIKTDQQRRIKYCNQTLLELIQCSESEVMTTDVDNLWQSMISNTLQKFTDAKFQKAGFYNGFCRYKLKSGDPIWFFFDAGKRYSPDGEWLGFEFMGYPASQQGIAQISELDEQLQHLEKTHSLSAAEQYLDQFIESLGCSYDEYVCSLQAL